MNNLFNCSRCGYETNKPSNLKRHLNNKIICNALYSNANKEELLKNLELYIEHIKNDNVRKKNNNSNKETKDIKCNYCGKSYSNRFTKSRHQKTCEKKKIINNIIEQNKNSNNVTINQINNINNILNVNNLNVNINIITNLDEFNAKAISPNLNSLFSVGTYLVDKFLENNCQYFIDCIHDFKKKALSENDFSVVSNICKIILQSENPLTKNMFMDNKNDYHAYVNLQGKFYKIKLDDLIELFCIHIPEVIRKILKYKDELNGMDFDDKDFMKFELDKYKKLSFFNKKKEIIEILTNQLLTNRALIEDFLQKSLSVDDLEMLKPDEKFTFSIIDNKLGELKYSKLGIKPLNYKPKRIRTIKTYDLEIDDLQNNMQNINQVNSTNVYSDIE